MPIPGYLHVLRQGVARALVGRCLVREAIAKVFAPRAALVVLSRCVFPIARFDVQMIWKLSCTESRQCFRGVELREPLRVAGVNRRRVIQQVVWEVDGIINELSIMEDARTFFFIINCLLLEFE